MKFVSTDDNYNLVYFPSMEKITDPKLLNAWQKDELQGKLWPIKSLTIYKEK